MKEWKTYTVQELVDLGMLDKPMDGNHGGVHPKSTDYVSEGVPFIMANNLVNGLVDYQSCYFITEEQAKTLKKGFAKKGDVLLTHKATIGRTALVGDEYQYIILTPQVTYYRTIHGIDNKYLKYYFDSRYFQQLLMNWAGSGSTRAYLGITDQRKLPIVLPPFEIQRKIADIIYSIDEKIIINNKLNANLIELASNIHKQWFIDFDFESSDGKMEQNEFGEIPFGWEVKELGTLMENFDRMRKPLSSRQREERKGNIPYYGATSIMDYVDDFIFDDIYVLMGEDGSVMKEDGTPFLQYIWGKSWINNHAHVLKGRVFSTEILYLYLLRMNVASIVTGAVQLKISQGNMNSLKVVCAPEEIYKRFDDIIQPIFKKVRNIQEQNKSLTMLRDSILPKLMSGEVNLNCVEVK